jgi:hypothetical protein
MSLTHRHPVPARQGARGFGRGHTRPGQIGGSVDPPGVLGAVDTITTNHVTNLLPIVTPLTRGAWKLFQSPVAERHLEAEVTHCVGGVISPLLANIALSALDEHFHAQWHSLMDGKYQREKRRKSGAGNWRLVRYADDCAPRTQREVSM